MMTDNQKYWWKMAKRALISLICISCFMGGCTWINKQLGLKDDHHGEELIERIIESETGLDIDLSPSSEEEEQTNLLDALKDKVGL